MPCGIVLVRTASPPSFISILTLITSNPTLGLLCKSETGHMHIDATTDGWDEMFNDLRKPFLDGLDIEEADDCSSDGYLLE